MALETRVKVIGLKKVLSIIRKQIILELRSKEMRVGIAEIVIDSIRSNKIRVTSDITLAFREYFEQFNRTHPDYRRENINFTFTGKLLKDLENNVRLESKKSQYTFIFKQSDKIHPGYKFRSSSGSAFGAIKNNKSGANIGKQKKGKSGTTQGIAFSKITEYLNAKGYDYLNIDAETLTRSEKFIQNRLSIRLKKFLRSQ